MGILRSAKSFGVGLGGQNETGVLRVMFDPVASAAGRFSSLRPRQPGTGDGFEETTPNVPTPC